jgi:phage FluMu gp28-like protein
MEPHYALGFDFARVADLSVLSLLAIEKRLTRRESLSIEMRGVPQAEQEIIVGDVMAHVRTRLIGAAFDATGMGFALAEAMGRKFGIREKDEGAGLVWPIKFSEDWYRQNMPPLKAAFEDDTLALIKDDEHLSDLRSVKLVRGIARVPPTREGEKGKERHGDFAIALALAYFASRMRWVSYAYEPVPDPRTAYGRSNSSFDYPDRDDDIRNPYAPPLGTYIRGGLY